MRTVTIKSISYEGFYGQTRTVDFSPVETVIRGDVKLGKTTVINAFMWCLLGSDIEGRANYMLYDQSIDYGHDMPASAKVSIALTIDGEDVTLMRTAKQKWVRDKGQLIYKKAATDEYHYMVDGVEVTAGEFADYVSQRIAPAKMLAFIANISHWRKVSWRTLREMLQAIVGDISDEDFSRDYSRISEGVKEEGVERLRKSLAAKFGKCDKRLDRLRYDEERIKEGVEANADGEAAERRLSEIRDEQSRLEGEMMAICDTNKDAISRRDEIAQEIVVKERAMRAEEESYNDSHNEVLRDIRKACTNAEDTNRRNGELRALYSSQLESAEAEGVRLSELLVQTREKYKVANAKTFDGACPTCGTSLLRGDGLSAARTAFKEQREAILEQITREGIGIKAQVRDNDTLKARIRQRISELEDVDTEALLCSLRAAEEAFVLFPDTERGKQLKAEIADLYAVQPPTTWAADMHRILQRQGELRLEAKQCEEVLGRSMSNKRIAAKIDEIAEERASVVREQMEIAKAQNDLWEYERELADIIRVKANRLFPSRTEVIMTKRTKSGEIDYDVCQIRINGEDATATNTADRMNAGIDLSTVFMRYADLEFPLFVDGAESNTAIESYGRQVIKTVVDKSCPQLMVEKL